MRAWFTTVALTLVALASAGCGDGAPAVRSTSAGAPAERQAAKDELQQGIAADAGNAYARPEVAPAPAADQATGEGRGEAGGVQGDRLPSTGAAPETAAPAMVIRTGNASVEVDTLEPAVSLVRQLAARLGGYVANTSMQGGREQIRQATLELKVPAARFDDLTTALQPVGKIEYLNVNAEDVGEEYTDVTARVANARRLEERLIELLATRTGRLQDVLSVERELARVRETIERYEGRLRYLKTRTAVSTLSVTLHEPAPLLSHDPGRNIIVDAFVRAWRNFVGVIAALIASAGFLVPLAALVVLAVFLWRRYRKP